jgi:hypothetical protein
MREHEIFIRPDGSIQFIYSDQVMEALRDLGPAITARASRVEPTADGKHWTAEINTTELEDIVLGPFETRQEALDEEVRFVLKTLANEQPWPSFAAPQDPEHIHDSTL